MLRKPLDMFDEMDEMFARIFARMDREFMDSLTSGPVYRTILPDEYEVRENGNLAEQAGSPSPAGEPAVEVHHVGSEVKVIAGLPGISEGELRLGMKGNMLIIDAGDAGNHYRTSAELPPVDRTSMQTSLKNGVLEVTFTCL